MNVRAAGRSTAEASGEMAKMTVRRGAGGAALFDHVLAVVGRLTVFHLA